MGNSLGAKKKTTTVMKITGETIKIKTPVNAGDVVKDYPGLVLLDAEMVKHYGVRAKPLEKQEELKAKRLYFLVELPKLVEDKGARRVRSGINMSAKDRLESMMLARRSASDLSFMKAPNIMEENRSGGGAGGDPFRVKLRLRKSEVERLMMESKDQNDAAEKIMKLCMENGGGGGGGGDAMPEERRLKAGGRGGGGGATLEERRLKAGGGGRDGYKGRMKRVGFSEELELTWT